MNSETMKNWNSRFNFADMNKEADEISKNNGNGEFPEVPHGNYEVTIDKMCLTESKKGDPMLQIWFKIVAGQFKNARLFFNQTLTTAMGIHSANDMLRSMDTDVAIKWTTLEEFDEIVAKVEKKTLPEAVSFNLKYDSYTSKTGREFNTFKIEEIYDAE